MLSGRVLSYLKKSIFSRNGHSLSLVFIRCHSLSLVVIRCTTRCHSLSFVVTRCTTRCHSLSLVVIRCHSLYYSSSLDGPLVCFFINNRKDISKEYLTKRKKKEMKTICKYFIFICLYMAVEGHLNLYYCCKK